MQGAAAQLAELIVGDKILMVNSRSVVGLTLDDAKKVLLDCKDMTTVRPFCCVVVRCADKIGL